MSDYYLGLNILDWVLLAFILLSMVIGLFDGFLSNVLKLVSWFIALITPFFFASKLANHITSSIFKNVYYAYWVTFFILLLVAF